jgi:hypothetical protein
MKLKTLIISFVVLWLATAFLVLFVAPSLQDANNFGGSFGGISALFSGLALAMAIYSMVLQQKQSEVFEGRTLKALEHQASAIKLIEASLAQQANAARVAALAALIDRDERRVETLRDWGAQAGDDKKYINGINAAENRIRAYQEQLRRHATG